MRILDYLLLMLVFLWLASVLFFIHKKKKSGRCVGCSGGSCAICGKKTQK